MKPKDAIKLNTVPLDKTYPEETLLPEDGLCRYLYQPGELYRDKKTRATSFISSKIRINWIQLFKNQVIVSYTICKIDLIGILCVKN